MRELIKAGISKFEALCAAGLAVAIVGMTPQSARAVDGKQVVSGGGEISFTGASETNWVTNADGSKDLLLIFSDPATSGSLTFPGMTKAHILAVGGGGGGAGADYYGCEDPYGGTGGGGAGGFVETNGIFVSAKYTINVGRGGAAGEYGKGLITDFLGDDGEDSVILMDDEDWLTAYGGGGGGGEADGSGTTTEKKRGSGGGGSRHHSTGNKNGGKGLSGQGCDGGAGNKSLYGGGGGGAGAGGKSASEGGAGGKGKSSTITGTEVWYAGGGGGGFTDYYVEKGSAIPGGQGGGGNGGYGAAAAPTAGKDGLGGGGGGGNGDTCNGAKGGSGVVIVRIVGAIAGDLNKPTNKAFVYDGKPHTSYVTSPFYTVEGQGTATDIGVYPVTVTPAPGIKWADDKSDDPVTVTMTIYDDSAIRGTAIVTGTPIDFYGAAATNWVDGDLLLKFTGAGSFTLPGTAKVRVLAVGGGGGGGGADYWGCEDPYGGGGGGGAGGFVETNLLMSTATYVVGVGVGGAGGTSSGSDFVGKDGGDSVIYRESVSFVTAYGGGGGGGETDGSGTTAEKNRGSGGGGSKHHSTGNKNGGKGFPGQGNDGGAGNKSLYAGGGGGAGAMGKSASEGGAGGAGKPSTITGSEVWYAGGGGGGFTDYNVTKGSAIPGGQGGGGQGGYGVAAAPTPGEPGTGGGGGGADGTSCNGAAGGSGIVYVRISAAMSGELKKPEKIQTCTYDGNAHTSVVESAFYELTGDNVGTEVGEYTAEVSLKEGFSWPGGDTESPVKVKMTIEKCEVTFTEFSMASWTYTTVSSERPNPVCTVSPAWVKPVYEYATAKDAPEGSWSTRKPSDVGSYWVRARVPDTKNYVGETAYANFAISKVKVTFTDLFQKDWMQGTPDEATPRPRCTVDPSWVVAKYQYATNETDTVWSDAKPTELGTWAIRVIAPDEKNYDSTPITATFEIVKGRGGTFVDYVEIEIDGYKGTNPSVLTNFPYKITLSEETPFGFLYSRAGDDGNELGLTDAKGNDLTYRVDDWNIHGESAIWVKVPEIGPEKQTIRLYWMLRKGATAPDHDPEHVFEKWPKKTVEAMTGIPAHTFDLVVKDGFRVNYWTRTPRLTRTVWSVGGVEGTLVAGKLAEGTYSQKVINSVTGEEVAYPPTKGGAYRYIFTLDDPNMEYEPLEYHIDFAITTSTSMDDLQGDAPSLTANGRVMLANDDAAIGHEVNGQSYWHDAPEKGTVWWEHSGEHGALGTMPNLVRFPGSVHRLNYLDESGATNVLWRMEDVILGNTFRLDTLETTKCFLPWSSSGLGMASETAKPGTRDESGWMVMRNSPSAKIVSPCYTNGIGTVYFDAVNGFATSATTPEGSYRLVLQIATNVFDEAGHSLPPTDENCRGKNEYGNEDEFGRLREERWHDVSVIPLKRDKGAAQFDRLPTTEFVDLDVTKGGSTNNFYRICANVDFRGPVRFRICRVGKASGAIDINSGFIVIDNILVSYPKTTADLRPYGKYDAEKGGKRVIGQEGAFSVPFPAVEESVVYGGATNDVYMSGACKADPKSLVLLSRMYYRWRYANQEVDSVWRSVDLSPFDGFKAQTPLVLEYQEGDLEFWYESFMNIPYYKYYDYSGANYGLGGLYTEETGTVTNRIDKSAYSRFTGPGDDWFVRFRAGKSDWDEINVFVTGAYTNNVAMELIGDHTWRGLVRVPLKAEGKVTFSFHGNSRRTAWGELVESDIWWYPMADVEKMPGRGETSTSKQYRDKFGYEADTASNYIEFQFNDESGSFTIGHAEYQSFNAWHDAHREDGKFVGNYAETSGVSIAQMIQTNANMKGWTLLKTSDDNWNESFELKNYTDPGFPKYTDTYLLSHGMPHQWNGENGIFVDAALTKSNATEKMEKSGLAWQMRGKGVGNMSFTSENTPSGLDTVAFKARLAQTVGFYDFSIWNGDGSSTAGNYTFVVPALMSKANGNDCSPGASMSVVACYRDRKGCYEFRVERTDSEGMVFSIYKWWNRDGDEIVPECLGSQWFKGAAFIQNSTTPNMYAMFISVDTKTLDNATTIIAGLSLDPKRPDDLFTTTDSSHQVKYRALQCVDNSPTRFKTGGFGVLSSNCNGIFLDLRHYNTPLAASGFSWKAPVNPATEMFKGYVADSPVTMPSTVIYDDGLIDPDKDTWGYTPGRAEYTSIRYDNWYTGYGVQAPTDLDQTVDVYLKPANGGAWTLYDSVTVSKYGFNDKPFEVTIKTNADLHVMLKSGKKSTDVTVWQVTQTGWSGENIPNMTGLARDFIYTQARVFDEVTTGSGNTKVTNRYCCLQPARVKPEKPLSIRSPLLKGLGMIGFSYKDVKPGAEVWVQIATNNVSARLSGTGGYNESILSMEPGGDEPVGTWVTVRKYPYDELQSDTGKTYYIGLHDRIDMPLEGAIRIFVPTNVCTAAAANAKKDPDWGSITITDIYVHDEPALDTKSWMGWNLRTIGDPADSEKRMFLPDLTAASTGDELGVGLSAGLNNSYKNDIVGDPSLYDKMNPTIQSPTFGRYVTAKGSGQATIGQVRFRARLYGDGSTSAKVTLYGSANSAETTWGEPLTNFTVRSSRYQIFEYKAPTRQSFAAVRLVVDGVTRSLFGVQKVLLDEVVVSEKNDTAVGVEYLRPFRTGLDNDVVIEDILAKEQQPLADESWGVQTKLKFDKFGNDIDFERGFRVTFRYFVGETPWGYDKWSKSPDASPEVDLQQVGAKSDYIYRSTAADRDTIVPPQSSGKVVQYAITVYYFEKGNSTEYDRTVAVTETPGDGWTNPDWYWPVDKNRLDNGDWKTDVSPYTILDSISPGRAWINEANYNDGTEQEHRTVKIITNQFVEVAVPSGVDLTDWTLRLTTMQLDGDGRHQGAVLAVLGRNGIPASKKTDDGRRSGDYEFLVLESPETKRAGGIRDAVTGEKAADGTWSATTVMGSFTQGSLEYSNPYQLELVRPSGIVEHQFVIAGTNTYCAPNPYYEMFGYKYDGTNLVNELDLEQPSVKRFLAGNDVAWLLSDPTAYASFGVVGGAHGEEGGWSSNMRFTPGRVNEGQDELSNWYIRPSGGSCWLYLRIDPKSLNLSQQIGDDKSRDTFVLVNSGNVTNVVYTAAPWYQLDRVERIENGVTNLIPLAKSGTYDFKVSSVTGLTTIVAYESISKELIDAGLDPLDRYTPAVMKWLAGGVADGKPFKNPLGPIRFATYRGLSTEDPSGDVPIDVKGMYWFDIDPTEGGWWLRGDYKSISASTRRDWYQSDGSSVPFDNVLLDVKLYFSNDTDRATAEVFAPKRLQGPNNERSDEPGTYTSWTGVTFKVIGDLINGSAHNVGFLPFRWFVFGPGSFGAPGAADEYTTHLEVMDPFSTASPGYSYGWSDFKGWPFQFKWKIDETLMPRGVEMLKTDSTYGGKPPFVPPSN